MNRRKSGLETLLKYRKSVEEQHRIELANLMAKEIKEREKLDGIREAQRLVQKELKAKKSGAYLMYIDDLSRRSVDQKRAIHEINVEVVGKRDQVVEASKSRKTIEKVQDKRFEQYRQYLLKQESKALDEVATNRFSRKEG